MRKISMLSYINATGNQITSGVLGSFGVFEMSFVSSFDEFLFIVVVADVERGCPGSVASNGAREEFILPSKCGKHEPSWRSVFCF
jgi:hypothetical protein